MAFYNLRPKKSFKSIADFETWWVFRKEYGYTLEYHFRINLLPTYETSKTYGKLQDEFIKELSSLKDDFYGTIYNLNYNNNLTIELPVSADTEKLYEIEKKICDWFLPKHKAFAERWNLEINSD